MRLVRLCACLCLLLLVRDLKPQNVAPAAAGARAEARGATAQAGWKVLYEETFEHPSELFNAGAPAWVTDTYQNTDEYSDGGSFFTGQGVKPPKAFRAEGAFGKDGWLTVSAYSRSDTTKLSDLFEVVADPADAKNHVLRVASPMHTDGLVVRPTKPLPAKYRVCLRVGYASFGDGEPGGRNGYAGGEKDEPWADGDATVENGFYWLTILDATPRVHNNVWIHHHRKVVIDSDNNTEAWTNMWEGGKWVADGRHPVMMFGVDKDSDDHAMNGRDFLSWSNGSLQPSGQIRAADAYKDNTWYTACIERNEDAFVLTVSGDFKWGGKQTYVATIPASKVYGAESSVPDFFMFGDPHNNYYRGSVYYDDVKLEVWK